MAKATKPLSDQEVFAALDGDDELRVVINAGIVIEAALDELFRNAMVDAEALADMRLSYVQKVSLAVALGFEPRIKNPLKTLATIRNRFAHQLGTAISIQDAKNFYASFHAKDKDIMQRTWKRLASEGKAPKATLSAANPLEQFVVFVVTLNAALRAAIKQAGKVKAILGSGAG
ncbi:hypothetical protein GOL37_27260 [Sinorhizobium medicae]|nr:hypothetical protein [Sinorhizobium medicae]MDX0555524.1 hypothetical protein [Sinorhizobium medicae]MDX1022716.1 hypothetical protein [Sinorhizobium medicae]